MITEKGKQMIRKQIAGMSPFFATHIAVGCGAEPLPSSDPEQPSENSTRENLVFEMARAPIVARGMVYEDGVHKVALKAELPTDARYRITEIGVYAGAKNLRAAQFDSKLLASFNAPEELWYIQTASTSAAAIPIVSIPLTASPDFNGDISAGEVSSVSNDNEIWTRYSSRKTRLESPRFLNSSIVVDGSWTDITYDGDWHTSTSASANAIETSSIGVNLSKNSGNDQIRLAFSIAATTLSNNLLPDRVNIWLEFVNNFTSSSKKYAIAKVSIPQADFNDNYHVLTIPLEDFVEDAGFSWTAVNGIRIRSSTQSGSTVDNDWFVVYDGLRLENVSTENPVHGLVAYTQLVSSDGLPALKSESTNNFIEFRMVVDV